MSFTLSGLSWFKASQARSVAIHLHGNRIHFLDEVLFCSVQSFPLPSPSIDRFNNVNNKKMLKMLRPLHYIIECLTGDFLGTAIELKLKTGL